MSTERALNPKGDEQITVSSTVMGLTNLPNAARRAVIQVKTAGIYFTEDGVTPSSTNGLSAEADDILEYLDADYQTVLKNFKAIYQGTTDAKLKVTYYD